MHWRWEIDLGGTGRQFVLPPSIHPVTRKPYTWANGGVDWTNLHEVSPQEAASWYPQEEPDRRSPDEIDADLDELMAYVRRTPQFMLSEVEGILDRRSSSESSRAEWVEDRDGWLKVGFCLHNWSGGGDKGYELWCAFASQSDKFDEADNWRVWRSMDKGGASRNPVTMRTLYDRSNEVLMRNAYGLGDRYVEARETAKADEDDDFNIRLNRSRQASKRAERDAPAGTVYLDPADDVDPLGSETGSAVEAGAPEPMSADDIQTILEEIAIEQARDRDRAESAWEHELERTDTDTVKSSPHNIALIVGNDPLLKGLLAYNEFIQEPVYLKPFKRVTATMIPLPVKDPDKGDRWEDKHDTNLRAYIQTPAKGKLAGWGMKPPQAVLQDAVLLAAMRNPMHPVRDWLRGLRWDGLSRMDSVFCRFLGCPDLPYFREVNEIYCLAAVARIFTPGCKFDFVPVLEGGEGIGKSTFVKIIANGWFGELHADFRDVGKMVEQMKGAWQLEYPELSGLGRAEVNTSKAFVSCTEDRVRLAYARRVGVFPRQCVFIGTTNEPAYLMSEHGNRRCSRSRSQCRSWISKRSGPRSRRLGGSRLALSRGGKALRAGAAAVPPPAGLASLRA